MLFKLSIGLSEQLSSMDCKRYRQAFLIFVKLALVYTFILTEKAHASVGNAVQEGGEPWTCKVTFWDANGKFLGLCSGSFESNSSLNLAGHCIENLVSFPGYRTRIECPDRVPFETPVTRLEIARSYRPGTGTDAAKIRFAQPLNGVTILQRATWKEIETWLGTTPRTAECKLSGYGFSEDCSVGSLRSALLPQSMSLKYDAQTGVITGNSTKTLSHTEECAMANLPIQTNPLIEMRDYALLAGIDAVALPGDSGGPLYCRADSKSVWKFVGVASAYEIPSHQSITLVDDPSGKTRRDYFTGKNVPVQRIQIRQQTFWVDSQRLEYEPLNTRSKPSK